MNTMKTDVLTIHIFLMSHIRKYIKYLHRLILYLFFLLPHCKRKTILLHCKKRRFSAAYSMTFGRKAL